MQLPAILSRGSSIRSEKGGSFVTLPEPYHDLSRVEDIDGLSLAASGINRISNEGIDPSHSNGIPKWIYDLQEGTSGFSDGQRKINAAYLSSFLSDSLQRVYSIFDDYQMSVIADLIDHPDMAEEEVFSRGLHNFEVPSDQYGWRATVDKLPVFRDQTSFDPLQLSSLGGLASRDRRLQEDFSGPDKIIWMVGLQCGEDRDWTLPLLRRAAETGDFLAYPYGK
ncbi:hypothetical protein CMI48_00010 [Candidatus Pacearchaeota archaeon]|nr:hypothetical protein [Candidatus Pacearchaeota archaeon]|tara:strand:+ start:57 stop:725 length:669 start_codon:yes stop_codon:yes gene_type:complete